MVQAELRVSSGRQAGSVITLPLGKFLIGREEDCHLRPNSDLVSRHHCVFTADELSLRLRDLGSTNGTFVNGERIRGAVLLNDGDRVAIGKLEFDVVLRDPTAEDTSLNVNLDTQTSIPAGTVSEPAKAEPEPSTSETMLEMPVAPDMTSGDTAFVQPQMTPPGMYGQPLGYPQYAPQFGYPPGYPMPGYYPQAMGYPPPMGMYPGMPMQQVPGMPAPASTEAPAGSTPDVRLPDPETTGAKAPEPPKPAADGGAAASGKPATIPETAADIIKQYRTRRPT
ncbi:MAG: FHA domain-containing protein [Planctomyces sp.]|nr:FHA domain-containing protein [Planctomyces sp.]